MTLSLNPTLTQEKQQENKEIQVNNIDIVTQHKPMPTQQENYTESSINTQEPIGQTPNTTQDFDINNKEYQEFVKEFLTTKQTAKDHYDLKYSKDLLKQSIDKFEITQLANPLFIANNIKDMGREGIEFFNKSGDQIKKSETEIYDYLAKTGINHEMLGIKNFNEQKLKDAYTRQGLRGKTEYKQLNEEEKDYLKRQQNWAGALWDKMVNSEEKRVEELLRNDTRRYIDPDLLTDLIKIDSAYSSVLNVMKSSETATQDLQKKLKEMDIKAKERGYAAAVYDKKAKALAIIDKQGKKYYLNEDGVTANLDKIIVNNWNDILLSSIPVGGWGIKGAQLGAKGAGIALKNAGFKGLGKEAAKAGAISFAASPLDYVTLRKEVGGEIDTTQMLEFSAGNALGSAAGVMAIGTLAKGAGKAYNSIKDLKNLSTDDLKNIKISKYLDNEEASIHRKLAKFNKSEIDSNYEIFKGLQSDRVISKEMKDPTFIGNFMDKISDYNVLKHLSSKKESQDKLLSALFSNKELAREFAGKLTSEEATIVNKAIHAMGENFTRLSKEYEQQIIDEYAKSGKIKGLTPRFSDSSTPLNTKISEGGFNSQKGHQEQTIKAEPSIAKTDTDIIPQNLPEVYKHMLDEIDKQAKQDYKTSIDNLQNALNDTDFKATLLQGYKQVTDDAIDSLGLDNQLTNTLIRETQKLESKPNISLAEAIELRKNINEIMRNYEKSSSDLKKFRANKHLDNIKDNIDNAIKNALDSKVAQNEANQMGGVRGLGRNVENPDVMLSAKHETSLKQNTPNANALDKETAIKLLDEIQGEPIPAHLSTDEFLNGFSHIVNKENFVTHLQKATDSKQRIEALNLVEPTQKRPDFTLDTINKEGQPTKEFIKVFQAERGNKFYVLITARDNENFLLTGMPTTKLREVRKRINNAEAIEARDSGVVSSAQSPIDNTPTPANNPTQNTLTRQEADELFSNFQQANKNYAQIKESLNDKFAKALTKGMNKKDLDSRLTIEQWKQRVLDTQWGDSVKGLENTIFKNFNPRMQKHTQMLTILRALDRNVKLNDDSMPIDFTKILSDIENLEKLTLHPEIYPILDTFKSYAKSYQFAQEISKAKALENQVGGGALATTLEGRIKVFLTNRLFKKLFAFIPYIGDNAAITKALQSAIKDLKYPSEITLETLKVLNKADLDKGFKPIKDKEPRFEYKAHTPLSDKDLQDQIKGNTQILNPKDTSEIEAIASNPLIQNMERQAKYNEELTQKISQFEANKENIQQDILNNLIVATQEIKQNTELLQQLAQQLTHNNPIHTPNKSIIKAQIDNETYFITTDKNNITAIEKQELQNLAQPKTYDELMQRDKNENATLESYRDQYADIAEIKEAQAQKQLLLEYKPEVAKKQEISKDTTPQKTLKGDSITNPDISYAIQNENIPKEIAEKIANNAEISNIIKRDNFNKASVKYYDKDNMTMYYANIGNYIDDEFGMKGDTFFLNNVTKHEFYIPPTKSSQDFKEQSLNQIEFLKKAIKTQIDNAKDEKELHKNIREIQLKARENAENRFYDEGLEQGAAREFYTTKYDEAMQELGNYYKNYRHLESNTQIKEAIPIQDKDTAKTESFIDSYGKTHEVPKEIAEQWKNTFNLKSLDEAYIPSFTPEVKQALDSILQGEQIKLTSGSLVKLMQRDRLEFLPFIKETLEAPNAVVRQVDGAIIFAKDYRDEKLGKFFASVSKNDKGEWVISSNAPKNLNNLQNKIKEGGEVLYSDLPELPIIAKPELPAKALNSEANLSDIIPQTPQTKPYEVNENGRKYTEIPDDELADFEKSIKQALLLEPRQQELLKKINADSKDIDSYAEFMINERKIMKGHEFTFNQQQEGLADRFLNMANSLENPRDRNHYAENILANMKDDIEKLYKSNASEFLAREAEKPFYKQMDKIRKETDEIVEALNKERDGLHAEKEAQLKAQQETEKAAEIERIANYDLETAYKEKAHLEKIMQSNRSDYAPYSFSSAYNSEFLDKLDLVEQRIRDLKNKLPNKTPQENKPSKVEALKEFIDNARFQVNYAIKAKGTDTALKLIQQMIKDTNNTYEAKFLYRLKNEMSSVKDNAEAKNTLDNKADSTNMLESTMQKFNYDEKKAKDLLEWHKDSSPLTKDENGLPKVFYHGTTLSNMKRLHNKELKKPFEVFNTKDNSASNFSIGNWFSNDKNLAKNYADDDEGNFIYEVFLNIKKPFIMEKELTQEKIKEIDKIFKFTKKDKERGLRAVENLKQAKAELKESGFEFLQYDRESVKIRHIESGKEFSTPLYNLKKEDLHESIRAYEADLKHNPNLDESLQELKELDSLLKKDSPTLYEADFEKEFFKNETELYILAAARENEKLQEVVGGHYGVYGGYGRMYQTARIYPLQQFYKKAGYDGILFNDREIVAFDSNQIKHIDNKGSHTDTKGNITKTKPKNKESTHKYFNENSPNIMYANPQHLGAGILSGSAAGIETDENGNIVGFNPAKFAAGFLGGVAGSKAVSTIYKNKSAQRYATLAIKSIQQDYKSLSENNPAMFAKIMQKFNPRDFLKGKKQVQEVSKDIFNKELAQEIESALKNGKVETMPQAEFRNKEEFAKMFDSINGNKGVIKTPYKDIKVYIPYAWEHFTNNTYNTNRENIKGGFFETFKKPLFIVEQTQQGQKEPSVYFYKPFFDKDKNLMNLFGIGIQGHKIKFKTYYFDEKETRINNILKSENVKILYLKG